MEEFLHEYRTEAGQILNDLERSLLALQTRPDQPEEVTNIYRYLHTLKGSAGMFGYAHVEQLSHELEFIYSDVLDGARAIDAFLLDLSFHAADVLRDLIDGREAGTSFQKLMQTLLQQRDADGIGHDVGATAEVPLQAFAVILRPETNVFQRGINVNAILEELGELGEHVMFVHGGIAPLETQLKERRLESWFEVLLSSTKGRQAVEEVFMFLKATEYSVQEISDGFFEDEWYAQWIQLDEEQIMARKSTVEKLMSGTGSSAIPEEEGTKAPEVAEMTMASATTVRKSTQVSVATEKLDHLIDIVSELVIFRSSMQHLLRGEQDTAVVEALEKLERLTLRLRDSAFNIRLVALNVLHVKLERLVRSLSQGLGKEVAFITEGMDTELDRGIINALEAPLMHLIRNAIDHGIEGPEERKRMNKPERGLLKFCSYNSGDHVFIQIQDDGRGIDFGRIREKGVAKGLLNKDQRYDEKELVQVMMSPGFSTSDEITTVSGRGVGMDIVKREIQAMRGEIEVSTEPSLGTIFTLRLPLTLTILDTLVVDVSEEKYLIPINEVEHCFEQPHAELFDKRSRQVSYNGRLTPFVSLRESFGKYDYPEKETVVIVNKNDTRVAVVVDRIAGTYQTVFKPLNELLQPVGCFSGASVLGDGTTAFILDALRLKN